MNPEHHIEMLRKAIAENEQSLAKMKQVLRDLETCRTDSEDKHAQAAATQRHQISAQTQSRSAI